MCRFARTMRLHINFLSRKSGPAMAGPAATQPMCIHDNNYVQVKGTCVAPPIIVPMAVLLWYHVEYIYIHD